MPSYRVFIRNKQEDVETNLKTIGELRPRILERLKDIAFTTGGPLLEGQEILIFQEGSTTQLENSEKLDKRTTYSAYEKFAIAPVDLYRTVKMSQIHPTVRSLNPTAFCAVVPLYCAALTEAEAKYPPYYTDRKGRVSIRGASLCCGDPYTDTSLIMPWDEVTEEEQTGESHVPLVNFGDTFNTNVTENSFGILHTSTIYKAGPKAINKFDSKELKRAVGWCYSRISTCSSNIIGL
jgi:hypothetical protein